MTQRPFLSQANARTHDRTIADAVSEPLMTSRSDPEYCRRQAETCHEMAEKATDARDREEWLRLAQDWIELAEHGGGQVGKKSLSPSGPFKSRQKTLGPSGPLGAAYLNAQGA